MNVRLLARRLKYAAILIVLPFLVNAQLKTVTGKVTSEKDGSPISGATVLARGAKGTQTAADGNFVLQVPDAVKKLTVSSVGFISSDVTIGADNTASAVLKAGNEGLTEVVVIGYGTRKIKDLTGSVANITAKDFNKGQISTPEQLFQGRTPGVTVTPASGEPGAAATINIRGTSSIRSNQQPLYVVDGVPLDGGGTTTSVSGQEGGTTAKNPLSFINPNDIESISILKDASSAAIYGSRGANGVIIITTKNAKSSRGTLNFGSNTSVSTTASRYDLLDAQGFLDGIKNKKIIEGIAPATAEAQAKLLDYGNNYDWQDEIFRTAVSQNYNLSYAINKNKTNLRVSGAYDDQQGIIKKSYLKRLTGRINVSRSFLQNDALRIELSTNLSNIKNSYSANTNNAGYLGSLIGAAIRFNPTYPLKNNNGTYYQPANGDRNPVATLDYIDDKDNINRSLTSVALSYKINSHLVVKTTLGYDYAKGVRTSYTDPRLGNLANNETNVFGKPYGNATPGNGRAAVQNDISKNLVWENFITYDNTFKNRHTLNAVLGTSYQKTEITSDGDVYWDLVKPVTAARDEFVKSLDNFKKKWHLKEPYFGQTLLNSYFTRVNYNLDEKYFLTATVRADGSSKFGKDNRWGIFPAFGAKWKFINEKFAQGLQNTFSDLSFRANWGIIGSQDALTPYSAYDYEVRWITSNPLATPVTYASELRNQGNNNLKWEQATTTSIAVDWATKNRRLSGTVEYYNTDRKNMVFRGPTPGGFGASNFGFFNLPGKVNNQGLEISLNYQVLKGNKFNWDVNSNFTFMSNKVSGLESTIYTGEVNGPGLTGAFGQAITNGKSMFSWYMLNYTGFNSQGEAQYTKDKFLLDDLQILDKSALPTFNAGLTNNFSYGRWNASIFLNAVTGFYVYNNTANAHFLAGILRNGGNVTRDVATSAESPLNAASVSTRFLEKGNFLRLSNVLIGYNFRVKGKTIKSLNANISGQNLALFTNYSGLDPEVNVDKQQNGVQTRGFDYAGYPRPRVFSIGFNIGF
jgi:TonB-dependent starch-binding outer membrane protein SusC